MNLNSTKFQRTMFKRILSLFRDSRCPGLATTRINSYWIEYGDEPVLIQQTLTAPCKRLNLLAFERDASSRARRWRRRRSHFRE